jgi:hypothetical protein
MQRCLAIGGWTQPVSAAEKGSKSIQRDSTRNGSGEGSGDTESPDHHAVLGQAARIPAGSWTG